jgi:hypothetical protein
MATPGYASPEQLLNEPVSTALASHGRACVARQSRNDIKTIFRIFAVCLYEGIPSYEHVKPLRNRCAVFEAIESALRSSRSLRRVNRMNRTLYEKGLKTRKKVLGEEYVTQALAQADDFRCRFRNSAPSTVGEM